MTMNWRRSITRAATLIVLVLLGVSMLGCAKPAPAPAPTPKPAPATTAAPAPKPAAAKTTTAAKPAPAAPATLEQQLYQGAQKEGQLNWWDSVDLKVAKIIMDEFGKKYPGIKIDYFQADPVPRFQKIMAEHQAGKTTCDLTSSSEAFGTLKSAGLLATFGDLVNDVGFPKALCTPDLDGATTELRIDGVSYNTKLVSPQDVPKKWADLLDPKWKGKIATDTRLKYFIGVYGTPGWSEQETVDFLKKLKQQNLMFQNSITSAVTLQAAGEFPILIGSMLHQVLTEQLKGGAIELMPLLPMSSSLTPRFVLKEAPHPNAARLFMRFFLTKEGQDILTKPRHTGNPLPDSGTTQGDWMKKHGVAAKDILFVDLSRIPYDKIQKLYKTAIGIP